jgi:arylformamidase
MWIDISTSIEKGMMHWPGDPDVRIERFASIAEHGYAASRISMSAHTGTHVDAPAHYFEGGATLDELPLDALIGPARVVELASVGDPEPGGRLLLKTGLDPMRGIDADLARRCTGLRCLGIDTLTVGDEQVHKTLLGSGVWIVEGLRLEHVEPGEYDMVCLPLKIAGADGAPARAALRRHG